MVAGNRRSKTFLTPAVFWLVDPSKSRFILKHQSNIVENFSQFCDSGVNFFEAAMTSSPAFFGCLLRGITFLQPCRCNTRYIWPFPIRCPTFSSYAAAISRTSSNCPCSARSRYGSRKAVSSSILLFRRWPV